MRVRLGMLVTLGVLAASLQSARAVQPPEGVWFGAEPSRVRLVDPTLQSILAGDPAWQAFVVGEGVGWQARWDQLTRTPHRMWGPGLSLGPLRDPGEVAHAVLQFVADHEQLLGLGGAEARIRKVARAADSGAWYVDVDTLHDGLPVWRGGLTFRFSQGLLVMVGADTYPDVPVEGSVRLSAADAILAFELTGPARRSAHTETSASPVLLPQVRAGRAVLRVVWLVHSRTVDPPGRWNGFVDAETGELITFYNDVRFLDGALSAEVDVREGDGALEVVPLRNATVRDELGTSVTQVDGSWSSEGEETPTVSLEGPRLRIVDRLGKASVDMVGGEQTLTANDPSTSQAALSAFLFVQNVQDYARTLDDQVSWSTARAVTKVNGTDVCNAFWDGTLNFLSAGTGCRNTARLADVVYHEWGHGFHYHSILSGDFDGSFGEGAADTMSMLMTDDHRLAPNFFTARPGVGLRDVQNHAHWPEDYVASEAAVHDNGLMLGGSMWDTRLALARTYGDVDAKLILGKIYAGMLRGGPDLETSYDEAMFADDDDANLGNGTPHRCELVEGFGNHGLGPVGGFGVRPELVAPWQSAANTDTVLNLTIGDPAPECLSVTPAGGTLHWRTNGGVWRDQAASVSGRDASIAIPGSELTLGDFVEWWIELSTTEGGRIVEPSAGQIRPHTFYVGDVLEVGCEDFEENDGGYTHTLVDGEDVEGADDWAWGRPAGLAGDPARAYSGSNEWGTDLGGNEFNGEYQTLKETRLDSPVISTTPYTGVFLRYARWLTVEDGLYDQATLRADGTKVWSNWESSAQEGGEHHLDDAWELHVVDLLGTADDGELTLSWGIASDQGLTFGGWNIDDVCLFAPATPDNRLAVTHTRATVVDEGVSLSWTNPKWAPVTKLRVVRKVGDWPTGVDDGEVVFEDPSPELEKAATFVDPISRKNLYYAVYASDGKDWLGWTREGINAASVNVRGSAGSGGCQCDTSPSGSPFAAWLAVAWLIRRRRTAG